MAVLITVVNPHISRVTLCEVEVVLDGKVRLLRPTLRGVLTICKAGGFEKIIRGILEEDLDCMATGILAGLSWKENKREKIENWLFRNGLKDSDLVSNLLNFLEHLQRGGKLPIDDRNYEEKKLEEEEDKTEIFTLEQWCDNLFMLATGWLGWKPKEVLDTTIGALQLALDGKIDYIKRTNPFGSGEEDNEGKRVRIEEDILSQKPDPAFAAERLQEYFKRKLRQQQREGRSKNKDRRS